VRIRLAWLLPGLLVFLSPKVAGAFDSNAPGHRVHEEITSRAALATGFGALAASQLAAAVARPDMRETWIFDLAPGHPWILSPKLGTYRPEHHFDRGPRTSHEAAFEAGAAYVRARRADAIELFARGDRAAAIGALGDALHALQDFFSHSNFVDLSAKDRDACLVALAEPERKVPSRLRITAYFPRERDPESPNDPLGYTHGDHCKDSAFKNADAEGRPGGAGTPTRFEMARFAAIRQTTRLLNGLRPALTPIRWRSLAQR
jgi:hypothetical protein